MCRSSAAAGKADPIVVLSHSRRSLSVCSPVPIRGVRVPRSVEAAVYACGCAPPTSPSAAAFRTETCAGDSDTLPLRLRVGRCPGDRHSSAARADKLARSKCTHTQPGAAGHIPCAATAATPVARLPHATQASRVELLVDAHGEPHVELDDVRLLVVTGGVAGELEDLDHPRCCMRRYEGGQRWSPPTLKVRGDPAPFSIFLISWKRQSSI